MKHLYELVRSRAERYPTAAALGGQEDLGWRTLDSRQTLDLVDRLAAEIAAAGVQEGDRAVLWAPNHWRTPVYLFALWRLGAVAVPFDREINPETAAEIVRSVRPRCVITGFGERPEWAGPQPGALPELVVSEWWEPGSRGGAALPGWTQPAEELAVIAFTSGTTGNPKGCAITHANLCAQVEALQARIQLDASCRAASILPLSHLFELTVGLLYPFSMGAAIHYVPSRRAPDIVRVLAEQQITHMVVVPQFLTRMGSALEDQLKSRLGVRGYGALCSLAERVPLAWRHRLFWFAHRKIGGRLRFIASGGAALPLEAQRLWERLGVRVVQGYGASECSPVVACGDGDGSTPPGSVGRPLQNVEVRLSPEGELLVHGPNVMRGYWKDPARTAEVLHDGWYATGDLATIDATGNIRLLGRARDLIVLPSGMNVWPEDVEDVLRADPAIADAAVVAAPTPSGGATLHAYLIPATAAGHTADPGAIVARGNTRLAQHQRVATASWWAEGDFPRTAIGKVRRALLPVPDRAAVAGVAPAAPAEDAIAQAVEAVARTQIAGDAQTLGELGFDSLSLVDLALTLEEKLGRAVNEADLSTDLSVAQLRERVAAAPPVEEDAVAGGPIFAKPEPLWPYTWGRILRGISLPIDILYRYGVTRTTVLGGENLRRLPGTVIFAGTHHGHPDLALVRYGLAHTPARRLARRLAVATSASEMNLAGAWSWYGRLAFGLIPLQQRGERTSSLRDLIRAARAGNAVLLFPQGQHIPPEDERAGAPGAAFRPGLAHLAAALDAAVVPFGLAGTEKLVPPHRETFEGFVLGGVPVSITRGPLAIAFGEPLRLEPGETPGAFTQRVQAASFALTRRAEAALAGADGRGSAAT